MCCLAVGQGLPGRVSHAALDVVVQLILDRLAERTNHSNSRNGDKDEDERIFNQTLTALLTGSHHRAGWDK